MALNSGDTELTKMSLSILDNPKRYKEENCMKKNWYLRNGQDIEQDFNYGKAIMYIVIVKKKKQVAYGPVMQVAAGPCTKGKGSKQETREALMFLAISKIGFTSIVVLEENLDMDMMQDFEEDIIVRELEQIVQAEDFSSDWFQSFVADCEAELLPIMEKMYKKVVGHPYQKPLRIKLKGNDSGTPTSSTSRPSGIDVPNQKRSIVPSNRPEVSQQRSASVVPHTQTKSSSAANPHQALAGTSATVSHDTNISNEERDEDEDTPLARYETEASKAALTKLILEGRVQRTTVMLHVAHNLLLGNESTTLVRPVDDLHVENIKTLMFAKPASFSAPFLLLVDSKDCARKEDWVNDPAVYMNWKFHVIGGNHGARAKLDLYNMYQKSCFAQVEAWVYAGLTKTEIRLLAWQHNIDQEYRKTMTNIDKIRACHSLFLESKMNQTKDLKYKCCDELQLEYSRENRDSLSRYDPMFQIAFRCGDMWDLQDTIFTMWQKFEVLGQKKPVSPSVSKGPKAKPPKKAGKSLKKTSGDLNLGNWRALQGLANPDHVKRLLRRVISRMISLEQMLHEGEKIKKILKVKNLFLQISGQPNWATCRSMFPEETEAAVLASWVEKLADQLSRFAKRKRKTMVGNEMDEVAEEELPSKDIPDSFRNFVRSAIETYQWRSNMNSVTIRTSIATWKNADGDTFDYSVSVGDVRLLEQVLEKRNYTLAVADIPYGFNAPGSDFDETPFSEQDILDMVISFSKMTTSNIWRFVIIHSLQQANVVMSALGKVCNAGIEAGIWEKPNINNMPSGNRLAWGFENWTVGYYSSTGVRHKEMYNFAKDESRLNIIRSSCVTKKSLSSLGCVVNPYQKPVALGTWFVRHFSEQGDWVADLCCGTGSTLVAALLKKCHCVAVDKGERQIEFVKARVMMLDSKWSLSEEAGENGDGLQGQEIQPPVKGEIGTLSTLAVDVETIEEVEEQQEHESVGGESPSNNDMNDLLLD